VVDAGTRSHYSTSSSRRTVLPNACFPPIDGGLNAAEDLNSYNAFSIDDHHFRRLGRTPMGFGSLGASSAAAHNAWSTARRESPQTFAISRQFFR
jgi:hypothetical protein